MPIKIDNDLPVKKILEDENIFVMDHDRAKSQEIRPLNILIVNLMPLKEDTELALLRSLANTPLQVNVSFLRMDSHESKNTSEAHLTRFYVSFDEEHYLNILRYINNNPRNLPKEFFSLYFAPKLF